jgi:uncharacterized membrane protein
MNKGSLRSMILDHPLHPIFTHFPMGLLIISMLWDVLGLWSGNSLWWNISYWSIAVGLLFAILAVVTGLIDFSKIPQGDAAENVGMRHMIVVILAATMYTGSFFFRFGSPVPTGIHLYGALGLSILGFILLLIGGWYGGELVYSHGVGRSNPNTPNSEK